MVIHRGTARSILIGESRHPEFLIALPPQTYLVVVQSDGCADVPVGPTVCRQQHDPGALDTTSLQGSRAFPTFEFGSVTPAKFQRRKSHTPMKSHH